MKNDIVGGLFGGLLFVGMVIVLLMMYMAQTDRTIQDYAANKTVTFVDKCRTTGEIDPAEYTAFASAIQSGDYKVTLYVERKVTYPAVLDADPSGKAEMKENYIVINDNDILTSMFMPDDTTSTSNAPFLLNNGDRIGVKVTRTGPGMTVLSNIIGLGGRAGDFVYEYSGICYHNGNK